MTASGQSYLCHSYLHIADGVRRGYWLIEQGRPPITHYNVVNVVSTIATWQDKANGLGKVAPGLFFPERGSVDREARRLWLRPCVAAMECLEMPRLMGQVSASWAGCPSVVAAPAAPPAGLRPAARGRPTTSSRAASGAGVPGGPRSCALRRRRSSCRGRGWVQDRGGHQPHQLGADHVGMGSHQVVGLGRTEHVGVDQVHADLGTRSPTARPRAGRCGPRTVAGARRPVARSGETPARRRRRRSGAGADQTAPAVGCGTSGPTLGRRLPGLTADGGSVRSSPYRKQGTELGAGPGGDRRAGTASAMVEASRGTNGTTSTTPSRGWTPRRPRRSRRSTAVAVTGRTASTHECRQHGPVVVLVAMDVEQIVAGRGGDGGDHLGLLALADVHHTLLEHLLQIRTQPHPGWAGVPLLPWVHRNGDHRRRRAGPLRGCSCPRACARASVRLKRKFKKGMDDGAKDERGQKRLINCRRPTESWTWKPCWETGWAGVTSHAETRLSRDGEHDGATRSRTWRRSRCDDGTLIPTRWPTA